MRPEITEPFDSPLEEILAQMPETAPPADLEARCLSTVRDLDSRARFAQRRVNWQPLAIAAAAGLVISLVAFPIFNRAGAKAERPASTYAIANAMEWGEKAARAPVPPVAAKMAPPAMPGPPSAPPAAKAALAKPAGGSPVVDNSASLYRREYMQRGVTEGSPTVTDNNDYQRGSSYPPANGPGAGPERPWYDTSPDRQKIAHTILSLTVKDVQAAYDEAKSVIETAKGYVDQDDLRLERRGERVAHLSARVPVTALQGVVAQLRELGEVTILKTDAQDMTREYRGQGAEIRGRGADEDDLVRQYEAAKDKATKRQLYAQIQSLRANNAATKGNLQDLSEKTHLAYLELTLTEKDTPLKLLSDAAEGAGAALGWVAVTAVIWLPLLVLAFALLRRKGQ